MHPADDPVDNRNRKLISLLLRVLFGCWMVGLGTYFVLGISANGHAVAGGVVIAFGFANTLWALCGLRARKRGV